MSLQKSDETIEDLGIGGLRVLQKKDGFRFGADSVLLSDFAKDIKAENCLDLCTGSAVVPILLSAKTDISRFFGVEIQEEIADMAKRSVSLNGLADKIKIECGDIKNADKFYGKRAFSLITVNPPYMPKGTAVENETDSKIIARHEIKCCLSDIVTAAAKLLKVKGHIILVHKPTRLVDIISLMRESQIEPKRIRFVHKNADCEPSLVLVDGSFKGGRELRVLPPLFLYDKDGKETEELRRIYGK